MKYVWVRLALAVLVIGCATKATKGLLEGDVPLGTLAKEGDLGFDRFNFPAREIALPSGLRVAYETAPSRNMVAVILAFDVGSTADPAGKEGLAHYVEHLVFRNRSRGRELALELGRLGAAYNAKTSLDGTTFHALAPAPALPALIEIFAGLMQNPLGTVAAGDATVELDVVRNEQTLRNETGVYGQLSGWMQSLLVEATHPYRRPIDGTLESLEKLTLQDARSFADAHYKPDKATMLVAGDVDGERLNQLLKEKLPAAVIGNPDSPVTREVGAVPLLNVTVPAAPDKPPRHQAAVAHPELWLGYLMPGKFSQNAGNVRLVASDATELRLRELMDRDPDVRELNVVPLHNRLATILAIQVVLSSDKRRDEVAQNLRNVVSGLWRPMHPSLAKAMAAAAPSIPVRLENRYVVIRPTAEYFLQAHGEELLRLRFKGIAETLNGLEAWTDRALERADYLQVMGKPGALIWAAHQATLMEEQALSEFSNQFLTPERARVAYVDPLPAQRQPRAGRIGVSDEPIADDRSAAVDFGEPFVAPPPPELANARQLRLDNGLTVVLIRRPTFPAVSAVLGFAGGMAAGDPPGVVEVLRWVEKDAGVGLPLNAVEAQPIVGPTFTGEMVRAGTRNLPNALYLLAQRIVDTDKTDWAQLLDSDDEKSPWVPKVTPEERAAELIMEGLYGEHPLARTAVGAELSKLRGEHMERWIPRMRNPTNALLAIVGNVELAEGERLAREWFGPWKGLPEAAPATLPPVPAPRARGIDAPPFLVNRDGDAQVHLGLACRLPPAVPGTQASHQLLASVLNMYINTMVRYRAGAAYSVRTRNNFRGGGASDVMVGMELETRRLPEALAALRALWSRLATDGFEPGVLSQARWSLSSGYNLRYETSSEIAVSLLESWSLGWPLDSLARYPEQLRSATPADLKAAFATCKDSTLTLVLGQKSAVDPLLAQR